MPIYNLIEYSKNYSKASGKLWNYLRYGPNNSMVDDINYSISDSNYFDDKTGITGKLKGKNTTEKNWNCCAFKGTVMQIV